MDYEETDRSMSRCLLQKTDSDKKLFIDANGETTSDVKQANIYRDASDARHTAIKLGIHNETEIVYCFTMPRIFR